MADLKETAATPTQTTPTEAPANAEATEAKKAPKPKTAKAPSKRPAAKKVAKSVVSAPTPAPARKTRKIYSGKERAQKLGEIEQALGRGDTIKAATGKAGISEQTYYQWKKAAAPTSKGDDLKDLLALEEENKHLKGLLAQRLREENAELKKRLGLSGSRTARAKAAKA